MTAFYLCGALSRSERLWQNVPGRQLLRRGLRWLCRQDMGRFRRKRGQRQNILIDVPHGRLEYRKRLRHLILLARELILIASELLYAAPHDGKIERHRFNLGLQFCGQGSG
jgi:hypothetical protein